jgi:outer membrane protein assembly factor BamB
LFTNARLLNGPLLDTKWLYFKNDPASHALFVTSRNLIAGDANVVRISPTRPDLKALFTTLAITAISITACTPALAQDWPQWRGPNRDGISKEKGLLHEWREEGPKLLWQKKDLGNGYSTPAIKDGRIFLINNKGLDDEYVQALAEKDGTALWLTRLGKVGNPDQKPPYPGARSTPTVDGKMVFALGSDGDLVCVNAADGKEQWRKNLRTDFGGKPGTWAYSESPLIDGDVLIVTPGGKEAMIVALNKKNGDVIWKSPSQLEDGEAAGYASAIVVNAVGVKQYAQFLAKDLVGVDAKTGKPLWRYEHTAQGSPANISTPIAKEEYIYTGTHYSGGGMIKLSRDGDEIKADEVYFDKKLPTAIGGAVLICDYMYGTSRELTMCINFKTGETIWTKEHGMSPASLAFADGKLYLHGENDGDVALLEATPEGYQERGHFSPPDLPSDRVGKAWEYPAIANGRLYIHDWGTLWCFDIQAANEKRAASRTNAVTTPVRN